MNKNPLKTLKVAIQRRQCQPKEVVQSTKFTQDLGNLALSLDRQSATDRSPPTTLPPPLTGISRADSDSLPEGSTPFPSTTIRVIQPVVETTVTERLSLDPDVSSIQPSTSEASIQVLNPTSTNTRLTATTDTFKVRHSIRSQDTSNTSNVSQGAATLPSITRPYVQNSTSLDIPTSINFPVPQDHFKITPSPLTNTHFSCYQSHCSIKLSRNVYAPVPCMACHIDDRELRWKCTWCCLRICSRCMEALERIEGRDLRRMIEKTGETVGNTRVVR